ncbi:NIPSNAP family protein [Paenibacillus soyae]|uniref:NIPSNAP family protein n=1 Tax=Paenibacillus soyae TaxID=2969249 RepID=A0A9X2MQA7_9BACL|nr:NIPSNAP family protein [Paenibacillus soyae]MCR2804287.1 NIPSNAP family protein [Paenibacillus soyae]
MLYELRIYYIHPGKMQEIQARFQNRTLQIFANHGLKVTEFWEDANEENNRLYYVMEHSDMETRNQSFEKFHNDPEWLELKRVTELNGPLFEKIDIVFLKTVAFFKK